MEKENEKKKKEDKETIIQLLDRIAPEITKTVVHQNKDDESTKYYRLAPEYREVVKITPFPTSIFDNVFEEDSIGMVDYDGMRDHDEDQMLSWIACHFIECVVDRKTVGPLLGDRRVSLFKYATMSDFAYLVQVLEQYSVRWFHLAARSLRCLVPPSDKGRLKTYNAELRLLLVYGVGKNGLSSEEGQERYEIIMDYLFENVGGESLTQVQRREKISGMYINLMEELKRDKSSVQKARKEEYASSES